MRKRRKRGGGRRGGGRKRDVGVAEGEEQSERRDEVEYGDKGSLIIL